MNGISVIVPVYNGARLLARSIASVTGERVQEIIIVDDGSIDDTLDVAKSLAAVDPRIRVVHTDNHGIYEARRIGIAVSISPYIAFLDADDRFCVGALDSLAELLETHGADIAMGGITKTDSLDVPEPINGETNVCDWTPELLWPRLMRWKTQEFILYVCNKLYRREMLDSLLEADGICQGEDVLISCQAFMKAKKTVETSASVYMYYQNPESVLHARFGRRDLDLISVWNRVVALMPEGELRHMAEVNRWRTDYTLMTRLILADDHKADQIYTDQLRAWRSSLAAHWRELMGILPLNRKALVMALRFAFGPSKALLRVGKRLAGRTGQR